MSVGSRPPRVPPWGLLLAPLLVSAALRDLWAPDEPRYAEVAREIYELRSFVVLHLCGAVYPDKPPLFYWLSGLLGLVSGWNVLAMRLVSIGATVGSAWVTARLARRWLGAHEAAWAPLLLLGMAFVAENGARLQLDPLLGFFCIAALDAATLPVASVRAASRRTLVAGALVGLAALTKGPVAFVHVGLVLLVWRWIGAAVAGPRASRWAFVLALGLALAPVALWAGTAIALEPALFRDLVYGQHVERAVEGSRHGGPPWKNLLRMPLLMLPWTLPVLAGVALAWRAGIRLRRGGASASDAGLVRALAWLAVSFVFFSAIPSKRDLYLLPAYPAAALLAAAWLARATGERRSERWISGFGSALLGLVGLALVAAPLAVRALPEAPAPGPLAAVGGLALLAGAGASLVAARRRELDLWARNLLLGWAVGGSLALAAVLPVVDARKSPRALAEWLAARPERPATIPCAGVRPEGYRFYGRVPTVDDRDLEGALEREGERFLGLVRERDFRALPAAVQARFRVLGAEDVGSRRVLVLGAPATAAD